MPFGVLRRQPVRNGTRAPSIRVTQGPGMSTTSRVGLTGTAAHQGARPQCPRRCASVPAGAVDRRAGVIPPCISLEPGEAVAVARQLAEQRAALDAKISGMVSATVPDEEVVAADAQRAASEVLRHSGQPPRHPPEGCRCPNYLGGHQAMVTAMPSGPAGGEGSPPGEAPRGVQRRSGGHGIGSGRWIGGFVKDVRVEAQPGEGLAEGRRRSEQCHPSAVLQQPAIGATDGPAPRQRRPRSARSRRSPSARGRRTAGPKRRHATGGRFGGPVVRSRSTYSAACCSAAPSSAPTSCPRERAPCCSWARRAPCWCRWSRTPSAATPPCHTGPP